MDNIIDKIKNGVELTSDEVEKTIWSFDQVKTIVGESRRWSQSCEVILKIDGKLYSVEYDKGLTENQENEYFPQIAVEVEEIEETIKVKKFIDVSQIKKLADRDFLIEKRIQEFKALEESNRRLIHIAEAMRDEYVQKIQQYNQNIKAAEEDLLGYIRPQIRIDECTKAKTEYSLKFPSAKISFSREVPFLIKPEDIDKVPDKYIKTKKEVDWENYKKTLLIHNNNAIDKETGEVKPVQIGTKAGGVLKIKIL
ncbi:MAG: hypothetical protein A2Z35_06010 [Actinobacteria bacterium RBG_19FT_COMBO_36_27]|nr:MAG: hypothetical protein A2Z35_06010 [Actinobacteria bacterium RBG_19FT_COMBO_36_27]